MKQSIKGGRACPGLIGLIVVMALLSPGSRADAVAAGPEPDLRDRVRALLRDGRYDEAVALADEELKAAERESGPDSLRVADTLEVLVNARLAQVGALDPSTRDLAQRALRLKEAALPPDDVRLAPALYAVGRVDSVSGDPAAARGRFERALSLTERAHGPDSLEAGRVMMALSVVLYQLGEYSESVAVGRRVLAIYERVFGPDSPEAAASRITLGGSLSRLAEFEEAETLLRSAAATLEKAFGGDHPDFLQALYDLANVLHERGGLAESRRLLERCAAAEEAARGADNTLLSIYLNGLGIVLLEMGDVEAARRSQERALAILQKTLGPEHPEVASATESLAELVDIQGEGARAIDLYGRAVDLREKAYGPDHPRLAFTLDSLAVLLARNGEAKQARPLLERSVSLLEKGFGPAHSYTARSRANLGEVLTSLGEVERGLAMLKEAESILSSSPGGEGPYHAEIVGMLAKAQLGAGDAAGALETALRAESVARRHFQTTARSLSEREALTFERARVSALGVALSALRRQRGGGGQAERAERAWDEVARGRAMVLDEMALRHRYVMDRPEPAVVDLARQLEQARARLGTLAMADAAKGAEAAMQLESARAEKERLEWRLGEAVLASRRQSAADPPGVAALAAGLPARTALVSYVRYADGTQPAAAPAYMAFVLPRPGGPVVAVPLGQAAPIEAALARWRAEAGARPPSLAGPSAAAERRGREAGEALRRLVWDPVARHVGPAAQVFVVPDGALHLANFAALPDGRDGYIALAGPAIHHLSAERDLGRAPGGERAGEGALIVGMPDFDRLPSAGPSAAAPAPVAGFLAGDPLWPVHRSRGSDCERDRARRFAPLPSSRSEVDEVARLWAQGGPGRDAGARLLTGGEASEQEVKRLAAGRRLVHIATHGFAAGGCAAAESLSSQRAAGPLVSSGLALAGANLRATAPEGQEDGMLTAEEIASLDLSTAEWVVLSACETGVGTVQDGEGVLGLRRAVEVAGADALIMSLWPVDDDATREWMRALYEARREGRSTVESVHQAQRRVLEVRRRAGLSTHPFYWGAFVAAGDWR